MSFPDSDTSCSWLSLNVLLTWYSGQRQHLAGRWQRLIAKPPGHNRQETLGQKCRCKLLWTIKSNRILSLGDLLFTAQLLITGSAPGVRHQIWRRIDQMLCELSLSYSQCDHILLTETSQQWCYVKKRVNKLHALVSVVKKKNNHPQTSLCLINSRAAV